MIDITHYAVLLLIYFLGILLAHMLCTNSYAQLSPNSETGPTLLDYLLIIFWPFTVILAWVVSIYETIKEKRT